MKCRHGISVRKRCYKCEAENGQEGSKSASVTGYAPLIRKVLEQCHTKIDLYNQNSQAYLGGIEATRLLKNIEEALSILPK